MAFIRALGLTVAFCVVLEVSLSAAGDAPVLKLTQYLVAVLAVVGAVIIVLGVAVIRVAREDTLRVVLWFRCGPRFRCWK